ncbi:uncharacterized protein LOC132799418 [Ziziphus jujuba]|uniref:Uncharacterized protein LOC132799418 n=1 Tax=Ziziphus jujuba TaxID=326968 RepID=A0ABM3ZRU7_ZIZJJ|nr:uncharacterized protein LOC132799418 [Ziziphus jujuba]
MPLYPYLKELELRDSSLKTFQRTQQMMIMKNKATASSSSISPLSNLSKLFISLIENLQSLPDEPTGLTSLKTLYIHGCLRLKYLSTAIRHLSSLQELKISTSYEALDIFHNHEGDHDENF